MHFPTLLTVFVASAAACKISHFPGLVSAPALLTKPSAGNHNNHNCNHNHKRSADGYGNWLQLGL